MLDKVTEALNITIEEMAFSTVVKTPKELIVTPTSKVYWVILEFTSKKCGKIHMIFEEAFTHDVYQSLFDKTLPSGSQKAKDLSGEICNSFAGVLMADVFPGEKYDVGLPNSGYKNCPDCNAETVSQTFMDVEGNRIKIAITLDPVRKSLIQ